jgi:hypothetical protein
LDGRGVRLFFTHQLKKVKSRGGFKKIRYGLGDLFLTVIIFIHVHKKIGLHKKLKIRAVYELKGVMMANQIESSFPQDQEIHGALLI